MEKESASTGLSQSRSEKSSIIDGGNAKVLRLLGPQGLPDIIDCDGQSYVPQHVCTYYPTEFLTRFDEHDNEIETNDPSYDCGSFECSACGFEMMFGEMGWFDEETPYKPHFNYCPNCGAKVVSPEEFYGDVKETR